MAVAIPLLIQVGIAAGTAALSSALAPKPKLSPVDKGRFDDLRFQTAEEGAFEPMCFGKRVRLAGNIIWATSTKEYVTKEEGRSGGKGGGGGQPTPPTNTFTYKKSFAVYVCSTPVKSYRRISENLETIFNNVGSEVYEDFFEAELHTAGGGAVAVEDFHLSGGRGVRLSGSGQYVEISLGASAGLHTVTIFYKAASSASVFVSANGGAETSVSLPATGDAPAAAVASVTLKRGANTLKLRRNSGTADIDRVYVSAAGVTLDPGDTNPRSDPVPTFALDLLTPYPADEDNPVPYYNQVAAFDADGYFEGHLTAGGQARFELFAGKETQPQSAIIVAREGAAETPAWRDDSYFVAEDYLINPRTQQLGNLIFEVEPEIQALDDILEYLYTLDGKVTAADCDFSALSGLTPDGFVLDHRAPLEEWVSALETWFNFDIVPRGGKITSVPRGGAVATRLYERELRAHAYGSERPRAAVKVTHEDPADLPGSVDVLYLDPSPSKDFHAGNQTATRTVGFAFDKETLSFPIVGDADTAHAVGLRFLDARHLAAKPASLVCGFAKRHLIPTDIVEVEMDDGTLYTYRIISKQADLQSMVKFGVVPERASVYSQTGAGTRGRGGDVLLVRPPANTLLVVADCVPVRQADMGSLSVVVGGCPRGKGSWAGYHLNKLDQNEEYEWVGSSELPATIGVVETASQSTAGFGLEAARSFVVKLYHGSLESRTEEEARAERVNLALYGKGDRWEVIQFLTVAPQTASAPYVAQYLITGVISGQYGTEGQSATHQADDFLMLVDSAVRSYPMRAADATREQTFVAQTAGQALADAEAAGSTTFTFQGNSRKPLAISRVETDPDTQLAPRDSEGSILVAPWPRTNVENVGDEYLAEYLTDDRSAVVHSVSFGEEAETPALFKSHAVLLSGEGAEPYINVTGNTLSGTGDDVSTGPSGYARARSLQRILKAGNYAEATLKVSTAGDVAAIGLIGEQRDWKSPASGADYYDLDYLVRLVYAGGQYEFYVSVDGVDILALTDGITGEERVRVEAVGAVVRFYRHTAEGLVYLTETARAPTFPLRAWAAIEFLQSGVTTSVKRTMMTTRPLPVTALTAEQQQLYYGGLKQPVQVRISQHSGVREIGYGFTWDGEI